MWKKTQNKTRRRETLHFVEIRNKKTPNYRFVERNSCGITSENSSQALKQGDRIPIKIAHQNPESDPI